MAKFNLGPSKRLRWPGVLFFAAYLAAILLGGAWLGGLFNG